MKSHLHWLIAASFAALPGCIESTGADTFIETTPGEDLQPSSFVYTNSPCTETGAQGDMSFKLYWPRDNDCVPDTTYPLAVMVHGNGFGYSDYDYLLSHLAQNGFIAISVERYNSEAAFLQDIEATLEDYVLTTSPVVGHVNATSIAIVGHSFGGRTARKLAAQWVGHPVFGVKAVVTLAQNGNDPFYLDGTMTRGYLAIHGSIDHDETPEYSFIHYDNAGAQGSQNDPANDPLALNKSFKLLINANHGDFGDPGAAGVESPIADQTRDAVKAYTLTFLRSHLKGDHKGYDPYIRDNMLPAGWSGQQTISQFRDGGKRRTIGTFEDGVVPANTNLGNINVLDLGDPANAGYFNDTHALVVQPAAAGQYVRLSLPAGKTNLTGFKWISLRIGQASGAPASNVSVNLYSPQWFGGWGVPASITNYGEITTTKPLSLGNGAGPTQVHTMGTIRVPLSAFSSLDNVTMLQLSFGADAVGKSFVIDDVEFYGSSLVSP
ncbi:MAG: hypothetical protein IPK82_19655 [Polyangiaceae bacterium]|nr:hypothetical protein [Polyangiaceae bacterium]